MERNKTEQNMTYEATLDPLSDAEFDDALSKTLSAAVSSRQKASFSSTEDFADWLRQGEQKRKQRRCRRIVYILAAAAAVFAFAIYLCTSCFETVLPASILLPWDSTPTYADSDTENNITEENGSIVIGGDGNTNTDTWTATFTSYDDLPEKYKEEIIWFEELPEGYEVGQIEIEQRTALTVIKTSVTSQSKEVLRIKQTIFNDQYNTSAILNQYDTIISCQDKTVYIKQESYETLYMFIYEKSAIKQVSQNKIETMIASIKIGLNM